MTNRVAQRAAAYVVALDTQGQILLTQFHKDGHPRSGAWTLPGGGMEWGEQAHETALRELKEETGMAGTIGQLLGVQSQWFEAGANGLTQPSHAVRLVFMATDITGEMRREFDDDDTTIAAAWFSLKELNTIDRVAVVDFGIELATAQGALSDLSK